MKLSDAIDYALYDRNNKTGKTPFLDQREDRDSLNTEIRRVLGVLGDAPLPVAPALEIHEGQSILDALGENGARIFEINKMEADRFEIRECCDSYFECSLSRAQVLQLIEELKEMVK